MEGKYVNGQVTKYFINQPHIGLLFQIYLHTNLTTLFIFTLIYQSGLVFIIMNVLSELLFEYYRKEPTCNRVGHYYNKSGLAIPFRLEAAACPASLPGRVKSSIFIARPSVAHPVKG